MTDISGFGLQVNIIASRTFPAGLLINQFADNSDPLDMASIKIGDAAMGLNGNLITWSKAVPIPAVLNVVPGSFDDLNLQILFDANRVAQYKSSAQDIITMTVVYPDFTYTTLMRGKPTDFMPGKSIAGGENRIKTRSYAFMFADKIGL